MNWEDPIYDQNEDFSVEDAPEVEDENPSSEDDSKNAASGNNLKAARQPVPLLESSAEASESAATAGTSSSKSGRVSAANAGGANTSASGRGHVKSEPALKCDVKRCELPACRCGGTTVPGGGAQRNSTPQLVILTFDDAVNDLSKRLVMGFIKKSS